MPAKSKSQLRFMKGVANGAIKAPGLSKSEANEYTAHNTGNMGYENLPDKVNKKLKAKKRALEKLSGR